MPNAFSIAEGNKQLMGLVELQQRDRINALALRKDERDSRGEILGYLGSAMGSLKAVPLDQRPQAWAQASAPFRALGINLPEPKDYSDASIDRGIASTLSVKDQLAQSNWATTERRLQATADLEAANKPYGAGGVPNTSYLRYEQEKATAGQPLQEIYDPASPTGTRFVPRGQAIGQPGKPSTPPQGSEGERAAAIVLAPGADPRDPNYARAWYYLYNEGRRFLGFDPQTGEAIYSVQDMSWVPAGPPQRQALTGQNQPPPMQPAPTGVLPPPAQLPPAWRVPMALPQAGVPQATAPSRPALPAVAPMQPAAALSQQPGLPTIATAPGRTPAPPRQQLTEDQAKNRQLFERANAQLSIALDNFDALASLWNQGANIPVLGSPALAGSQYQRGRAALEDIATSYTYSVSGATAGPAEVAGHVARVMPNTTDSAATIDDKKQRLQDMVDSIAVRGGLPKPVRPPLSRRSGGGPAGASNADPPPPGIDPGDWQYMTPEQRALWQK